MQFLEQVVDICTEEYAPVWNIVGIVINVIMIGIPILLIVLAMIDFAKAVIANKEDEQKKATKLLGKRFLYAIGVFASVWIVTTVLSIVSGLFSKQDDFQYDESAWKRCWSLIRNGTVSSNSDNNSSADEKKCYKCSYSSIYIDGDFYTFAYSSSIDQDKCVIQNKIKSEDKCLKKNGNGACYLCGKDPGFYNWKTTGSAGCVIQRNITDPTECDKKNTILEDKSDTDNNKGACYYCKAIESMGIEERYEWSDSSISNPDCFKKDGIDTKDDCDKLNGSSSNNSNNVKNVNKSKTSRNENVEVQ